MVTCLRGQFQRQLLFQQPDGPSSTTRAATGFRRHSRTHTAIREFHSGGNPSCPERSIVDSRRRAHPSACCHSGRYRSAPRTRTLALSHPVRVITGTCGGSLSGADSCHCTRTCECTCKRATAICDSEPARTTAFFSCASRPDAYESVSSRHG